MLESGTSTELFWIQSKSRLQKKDAQVTKISNSGALNQGTTKYTFIFIAIEWFQWKAY